MTQAKVPARDPMAGVSRRSTFCQLSISISASLFLMLPVTHAAHAKNAPDNAKTSTNHIEKKKSVTKVTHHRSTSEETRSERDRRLYRECKGLHNAGACRGYTR